MPRKTSRVLLPLISILLTCLPLSACAGAAQRAKAGSAAPSAAYAADAEAPTMASTEAAGFSDVNTDTSLVTQSHVRAWTDDLLGTASRFRAQVYAVDGYVINERIDYGDRLRARTSMLPSRAPRSERGKAVFTVSVPLAQLPAVLDWVRGNALVVEQYVHATRDPALPTPERTTAHVATSAPPPVRYAKLNVYLEADRPQIKFEAARVAPSVRGSLLVTELLGDRQQRDVRAGAAIGIALPLDNPGGVQPAPMLEVAGYPAHGEADAAVIATLGVTRYARSRGDGGDTWFNPFAGLRAGYGYVGDHALVLAGELGLELYKSSGVAVSASVRPQGIIASDSQAALEAGAGVAFAF